MVRVAPWPFGGGGDNTITGSLFPVHDLTTNRHLVKFCRDSHPASCVRRQN